MRPEDPQEVMAQFLTPMADDRDAICAMRRCLVEDAKLGGYAEMQSLPIVDLYLLYEQYHAERELTRADRGGRG